MDHAEVNNGNCPAKILQMIRLEQLHPVQSHDDFVLLAASQIEPRTEVVGRLRRERYARHGKRRCQSVETDLVPSFDNERLASVPL